MTPCERIPKNRKSYIFYRTAFLLLFTGSLVIGIVCLLRLFNGENNAVLFLLLFVLLVPEVIMVFNIAVFPFQYSIFGRYERSSAPEKEKPVFRRDHSWGAVKFLRVTPPFFSWVIFPSGICFKILWIGKAFISFKQIEQLYASRNIQFRVPFLARTYFVLKHRSREVRSPLFIPQEIFQELNSKMEDFVMKKGDT